MSYFSFRWLCHSFHTCRFTRFVFDFYRKFIFIKRVGTLVLHSMVSLAITWCHWLQYSHTHLGLIVYLHLYPMKAMWLIVQSWWSFRLSFGAFRVAGRHLVLELTSRSSDTRRGPSLSIISAHGPICRGVFSRQALCVLRLV